MIAMHAEATDDPQRVRWVITGHRMPRGGRVRRAPARLGALLDSGVIEAVTLSGADVTITLSSGQSWRVRGDEIRVALEEALRYLGQWTIEASDRCYDIALAARELLDGPIGDVATAHGGTIELVEVVGEQVRVRLAGACHGCLAAESTLHGRLLGELRRRFGDSVTVSVVQSPVGSVGRRRLALFVRPARRRAK